MRKMRRSPQLRWQCASKWRLAQCRELERRGHCNLIEITIHTCRPQYPECLLVMVFFFFFKYTVYPLSVWRKTCSTYALQEMSSQKIVTEAF
jgi:hypothetical protein